MTAILDFINNIKTTAISIGFNDILEIIILAFFAYYVIIWIKDTRAAFVVKGLLFIGGFFIIATLLELNTILYIARGCLDILVIALLVIFQPELRAALEKLGKDSVVANVLTRSGRKMGGVAEDSRDKIVDAVFDLSKTKTGALIVFEQDIPLNEFINTGIKMDAQISKQLLVNIFEHNTPLHDGAAIISDNKIVAATCYLPLSSNNSISKSFGTRHRAALGVSEETDALAIIVSEETGYVSVAKNKKLIENLNPTELKAELEAFIIKDDSTSKKIIKEAEDEE